MHVNGTRSVYAAILVEILISSTLIGTLTILNNYLSKD